MVEEIQSSNRWPLRHRVAAALLTALPLLAVGGALLPNVIEVNALQSGLSEDSRAMIGTQNSADEILVPRNFWTDVVPELNELASLFVDVAAVSETLAKVRSITGLVATERDLILLPDGLIEGKAHSIALVSSTPPVGAPGQATPELSDICAANGASHVSCFDDEFTEALMAMKIADGGDLAVGSGGGPTTAVATAVPVPEPSTGLLIGMGLFAMALARRRA